MNQHASVVLTVLALLVTLTGSAFGADEPSSILFFPLVDIGNAKETLISVTNSKDSAILCSDGYRESDVIAHFSFVTSADCLITTWEAFLVGGETLSVLARHLPIERRGYLVVMAVSVDGNDLWTYNHLMGRATVFDADLDSAWCYNAIGFQAKAGEEAPLCNRYNPDVDVDGKADFNNQEYEAFSLVLYQPAFVEEKKFDNRLVVMSLERRDLTEFAVLFFNNEGDTTIAESRFECWWSGALTDLSPVAADLDGDTGELPFNLQTGWLATVSEQPVLAVFMEEFKAGSFKVGSPLLIGELRSVFAEYPGPLLPMTGDE